MKLDIKKRYLVSSGGRKYRGGMATDDLPPQPVPPATGLRLVTPPEDAAEGGDPVCWAHLVCEECGAVTAEGHLDWCPHPG